MSKDIMEKVILESQLKSAIQNEELTINYQPQYNAQSGVLVGMEVLVRWINKDGISISPVKFIPLAEETGLIIKLDRLVMKMALKQFAKWKKRNLNTGSLSLNLSIKQLKSKDFIHMFKNLVSQYNIDPKQIELEVTEGALMENPLEAIAKLEELNNFGIKLSVDDFGTGYSSLSYLKKLPIHKLKIDKVFVDGLPNDEEDVVIVKSIIGLAQNLKLDVIAEGVETLEQRDFLVSNGCNKIQGYYYSKPLKCEEMEPIFLK